MTQYYYEIYFNNVPPSIDGGYCAIKVRRVPRGQAQYRAPDAGQGWNDHVFDCGRSAYSVIRKWAKFLGLRPTVYADGSVSTCTYNLDYRYFETLLWVAHEETVR